MELDRQQLRELTPDWETDGRAPTSKTPLELDSMYLVTLLDQLRQISVNLNQHNVAYNEYAIAARTQLDQLRVRISKDLRQVQEAEQYDETPSRESVHP